MNFSDVFKLKSRFKDVRQQNYPNTKEQGAQRVRAERTGRRHKWWQLSGRTRPAGGCSHRMLQPPASMAVVAPVCLLAPINGHLCVSHLTVLVFYSVLGPLGMWMVFYTSDLSTPWLPPSLAHTPIRLRNNKTANHMMQMDNPWIKLLCFSSSPVLFFSKTKDKDKARA